MTRRIAKQGYFAVLARHVLPARARLRFGRQSARRRDVSVHAGGDEQPDQRQRSWTTPPACFGFIDFAGQGRSPDRSGCVGYCMSGQYITRRPPRRSRHRIKGGRLALWGRHHHRQGKIFGPTSPLDKGQGRALLRLRGRTDRKRAPSTFRAS